MREDFDVMHVHGYGNFFSFFGALVCAIRGKPLVWTVHGYPRIKGPRRMLYYAYRYLMAPLIFWKADRIISVSSEAVQIMGRETAKKIEVIPNGIDTSLFSPKGSYRKQKLACFVGRLDSDKGIFSMLGLSSLPLLFIGPDEDGNREKLRFEAKRLGRKAQFLELDYQKMPSAYEKCRYVVLPSKYEGFPLTLLESVSMERPFVSNDVGEVRKTMASLGMDAQKYMLEESIGAKLSQLEKEDLSGELRGARKKLAAYSWKAVCSKVCSVYFSCKSRNK
jgi:glycosyltransferase involved in cell wall biosynthesis